MKQTAIAYILVRVMDTHSTLLNINLFGDTSVEINPLVKYAMDNMGSWWILFNGFLSIITLALLVILWNRNRIFRYLFIFFTVVNFLVVVNNYYAYITTLRILAGI